MNTPSVAPSVGHNRATEIGPKARPPASRTDGKTRELEAPMATPPQDQVQPESIEGPDGGKVPGVIRLLEAGHFKGVADVRLRINFYDELTARAAGVARSTLDEKSGELVDAVKGGLNELVETLAADEETRQAVTDLMAQFEEAVGSAADGQSSTEGLDPETLAQTLSSFFDTLTEGLTELLSAPLDGLETPPASEVPDEPVDEAAAGSAGTLVNGPTTEPANLPVDGTDDDPAGIPVDGAPDDSTDAPADDLVTPLDDALQLLHDTFNAALEELLASIATAARLPDPSPPTGNGAAYDKFLAIYNDLRGITSNIDAEA
jgi:hypothetical protein